MYRKILILLLLLAVTFGFFSPALAQNETLETAKSIIGTINAITNPAGAVISKSWSLWKNLDGKCGPTNIPACVNQILAAVIEAIVHLSSVVLTLANEIFNQSLSISVKNFRSFADTDGLEVGWRIIRDLMNLVFIGALFYIAIGTILGSNKTDWKKMIPSLMIAALLINFSMLFTRVMIDASNLLAVTFYDALAVDDAGQTHLTASGAPDISSLVVQHMSILEIDKMDPQNNPDGTEKETENSQLVWYQIIAYGLGKVAMMLTASFVLIVASILFIIRTIVLSFLLILSPFAFIGMVLEKGKDLSGKWWGELNKQLLFAPAYMFCFFVVIQIVKTSRNIDGLVGENGSVLMLFIIINGLLMGSIFVAQSIGVRGMKFATQRAGGLLAGVPAWFGQRTIGAAAANQARKTREKLQDRNLNPQERAKLEARAIRLEKVAKSTFDVRNTKTLKGLAGAAGVDIGKGSGDSAAKRRDQIAKDSEEMAKLLGPQSAGEKKDFENMSKNLNKSIVESQKGNLRQNTRDLNGYDDASGQHVPGIRDRVRSQLVSDPDGEYQRRFGQNLGRTESEIDQLNAEFTNKERNFNDINNGALATPEEKAQAAAELAEMRTKKETAEKAYNEEKEKAQKYLDSEIEKNKEVNKIIVERKEILDKLNEVGDTPEGGYERAKESNAGLTEKAYKEEQKKKQKDYESGAWQKEKYAGSLEAGLGGFGAGRPVPLTAAWTNKGRGEALAGIRKHVKGKSKEQQVAELLKEDKGDDEKPGKDGGGEDKGGGEGKPEPKK